MSTITTTITTTMVTMTTSTTIITVASATTIPTTIMTTMTPLGRESEIGVIVERKKEAHVETSGWLIWESACCLPFAHS